MPTLLLGAGVPYPNWGDDYEVLAFEAALLAVQLQLEASLSFIAAASLQRTVLVHDRALLDVAAYLEPEVWGGVRDRVGLRQAELGGRYELVLHLESAAVGLPGVYEKEKANNPARVETAEEAAALDGRIKEAWGGANVKVVGNGGGWEEKKREAIGHVLEFLDGKYGK